METVQIEAKIRDTKISANAVRKLNAVPAVVYGKGEEASSIQIEYQTFRKAFLKAGHSQICELVINGKSKPVIIKEVQIDPMTGKATHADLMYLNLKEEMTAEVPLEFTGVSLAVKDHGGIFTTVKHEVEVKCLPTNLPHSITVDISSMDEVGASLHVSDIVTPKGVTIVTDAEEVVATVSAPKEEEAAAPAAEAAPAAAATPAAAPAKAEGK